VVGARCVSGERQRREGFGAHGGVWEARRWVSRTQFTQKHNPRTQDAQASTDSREGRDSNDPVRSRSADRCGLEGYFPQDWSSLPAGEHSRVSCLGRPGGALRLELAWLDRAETPC